MLDDFRKMASEFSEHWRAYILQCLLATVVVFITLLLLRSQHLVITTSLASSAFIVFAMPDAVTARPRSVVGGHLLGLGCGALASFIPAGGEPWNLMVYAVAVGVAFLGMVVVDMEHPPAAGTALWTVKAGISLELVLAVALGAVLLSLAHQISRRGLRDLT
jgi:CBS-domain-containing membrane protein